MNHLPIFLDINGAKVVVDGGTITAARRVERALNAGAEVHVFDPAPCEEVRRLFSAPRLTHYARLPTPEDYSGCVIAYGASDDPKRDQALHRAAKAEGALVNVADVKPLCDFITPSIVDRSPVVVAISTSGAAPVIGRILRARIEALLPAGYGRLASFLSAFRARIETSFTSGRVRRRFWERMIDGPVADAFLSGDTSASHALLNSMLENGADEGGAVWVVGTGDDVADLMTFRSLSVMQRADVVFHDARLSNDIVALLRRDAGRETNELTAERAARYAQEGQRVVWLMPGDPAQDPEAKAIAARIAGFGVSIQVLPGVSDTGLDAQVDGKVITLHSREKAQPHAMSLVPRATL